MMPPRRPRSTLPKTPLKGSSDVHVPLVPVRRHLSDGAHRPWPRDASQGPLRPVLRRDLLPAAVDRRCGHRTDASGGVGRLGPIHSAGMPVERTDATWEHPFLYVDCEIPDGM